MSTQRTPPAADSALSARDGRRLTAELCLLVAVTAAALTLFFFTPRFVYWRGLFISQRLGNPDNHRAFNTLAQIENPWAPIDNQSNNVIAWRLLFPLIWHYLRLPVMAYLAVPVVGCVLTLWLYAGLTIRRFGDWRETWMATALLAALPWFFVATGWLTYFDSWLMLGLVVVAFVRSRAALAVVCLLTPWVDERFLFALPLAFATRCVYLARIEQRAWRDMFIDLAVVAAASIPYPAIRAIAWLRGDPESTTYVQKHWEAVRGVAISRFLEGLWSGFRAAWLMVVAGVWFTARKLGARWGTLFAALTVVSTVVALVIAADMSRTLAIITPVMMLGMWQWRDMAPRSFRYALPALLAANLLLPAEHVIWPFKVPIRYLYTAIDEYRNPPEMFQPAPYVQAGGLWRRQGDRQEARWYYDTAIKLDQDYAPAYAARAALSLDEGDVAAAAVDVEMAMQLLPGFPDGLLVRAVIWRARGNAQAAQADLQQALSEAPPDWPARAEAMQILEQLRREQPQSAPRTAP